MQWPLASCLGTNQSIVSHTNILCRCTAWLFKMQILDCPMLKSQEESTCRDDSLFPNSHKNLQLCVAWCSLGSRFVAPTSVFLVTICYSSWMQIWDCQESANQDVATWEQKVRREREREMLHETIPMNNEQCTLTMCYILDSRNYAFLELLQCLIPTQLQLYMTYQCWSFFARIHN